MLELIKIATCYLPALAKDRKGATALEYALLAGLIALAIVGGVTAFGTSLSGLFNTMSTTVSGIKVG